MQERAKQQEEAMASQQNQRALHAIVLPHPLQGHITPLLHLSQKLASSYNVAITFVVTQHIFSKMQITSHPLIKLVGLADNLPQDHPRQSTFADSYEAVMGLEIPTDSLLQELSSQNQLPSFIIADTFVTWAQKLALKYSIPRVAFATTNVTAFAVMSSTSKLIDLGILPLKTVNGSSKYVDQLITCFPFLPPLQPHDIPVSLRSPSVSHYRMQFVMAQFAELSKAVTVMVNSVTELEKTVLENLEHKVPTFCIGPTLRLGGENFLLQKTGMRTSLLPEQEDCLPWLDKQGSGSVLYVSFGSIANLEKAQLVELASGLGASNQPFLWVIRPGSFEGSLSDVLPVGFSERTRNRGYIVSWCPQLLVLSHRALGGFMTHCGWNSILENLCLGGVPMICWPHEAEQALNARVIVDIWKVGLKVKKEEDGIVKLEEVERVVRAVMCEEGAKELKDKAIELGKVAKRAVEEGGSSLKNIEKVLEVVSNTKASGFSSRAVLRTRYTTCSQESNDFC
ncbi:hypothetical protein GOP47_0024361 [Adiantum capillus-veneris]|uniref:Glycosyltransferase n=1 Tax=Adiantum capillus-veneris TaxID=13818 RepID=A0A9D4U4C4_ADICA|nr:hypothetical protein GOP47_0024361 [Adiantum capillus-veneris]